MPRPYSNGLCLLQPGDIVILDNLGSHKVAGIRACPKS